MKIPIPITPFVLALCAAAAPALAQTDADTRQAAARAARAARTVAPHAPGRVERALTRLETSGLVQRMFTPRDGFGVRIGGIDSGSAIAAGPSWRRSGLGGGRVAAYASGAASIAADAELEAGLAVDAAAPGRLTLEATTNATRLGAERFFGLGMGSLKADRTAFALDTRRVSAGATMRAAEWLTIAASGGALTARAHDPRGGRVPPISTRFSAHTAPRLDAGPSFAVFSVHSAIDYRDVPDNPRRGGRYTATATRYADRAHTHSSFTQVEAVLEQHLSAWRRQRVLTVRAVAVTSIADRGHDVPFYLQPTLGGSRLLRGFVTDRFRDRSLLALQGEYGFDLLPFVNTVLFYEAGMVAPRLRDLALGDLRRDYGLGFRFGSARTVAFRTDVAFGSGEGTRITMRLNHAF